MAKIIIIRNTYGGLNYLQKALDYVTDFRAKYIGGFGVNPYDIEMAYKEMLAVRKYFQKVTGNPLIHIVIAYNRGIYDINIAAFYSRLIAHYFSNSFQVLYCTHEKDTTCGTLHNHIIVNSVSFVNGQMITTGYDEMNAFCDFVEKTIGQKCQFYFDNKAVYPQI